MSDADDGADVGQQTDTTLGLHSRTVIVGGDARVALVLRPLALRQQRDLANEFRGADDDLGYSEAVIHASAMRGGYGGSREDIGDLLEGDDRLRCEAAMDEMLPFTLEKLREREERARSAVTPELVAQVLRAMTAQSPPEAGDATSGA